VKKPNDAPSWWPDGEAWQPVHGRAHGRGPWGRRGRGRWRPFGCLVLLLALFAAGAIFMALWALGAIVGVVEAPALVVGAGAAAFVVVVVGGLVAVRALRAMTRPLDDLIEASGRIEAGDYASRVTVSGSGGLRSLTRAFNQMSEQLQASDERRRAFLAEVTHELRTPLTVISGQLEAIEDGIYEADPERVANLLAQARQMSGLIEDLHTISLAEVGALEITLAPVDLAALAVEAVASFAGTAELQGVSLSTLPPKDPVAGSVDVSAARRVLANIISNALRHTPRGGDITLSIQQGPADGVIECTDTGSGMSPEMVERAFERFEKGADSDGSGLGLAIARDLMEAQGGSIDLDSSIGGGTQVRLRFSQTER
jgi:two-component system sensor histidine kinase BaeS